jgi:hypothetical protein
MLMMVEFFVDYYIVLDGLIIVVVGMLIFDLVLVELIYCWFLFVRRERSCL